jgi:hypothetical protein
MAATRDFRAYAFELGRVATAGKVVGRDAYSKLYVIENTLRVIIHSVLTVELGPSWWDTAVDEPRRKKAERFRARYASKPWHGNPGQHGLYYMDLADLGEILRVNSHLFEPVIPEVDALLVHIEQIREPRNVVCHMNWLTKADGARFVVLLNDVGAYAARIAESGTVSLQVPR